MKHFMVEKSVKQSIKDSMLLNEPFKQKVISVVIENYEMKYRQMVGT